MQNSNWLDHSHTAKFLLSTQEALAFQPTDGRFTVLAMSIGQRIREKRLAAALSQEALATLMGVSRETVRLWEAGRTAPSRKKMDELASHLKATPQEIEFGLEQVHGARLISPQAAVIGSLWERLPDERKREVFAMLVIEAKAPTDEYVGFFLAKNKKEKN